MAKFKVIEKSRFLGSEMAEVKGGDFTCGNVKPYIDCYGNGTYEMCGISVITYTSEYCAPFRSSTCASKRRYTTTCGGGLTDLYI